MTAVSPTGEGGGDVSSDPPVVSSGAGPDIDLEDTAPRALSTAERIFVAAALVLAVGMRVAVLRGPLGALDSDEAVVGLMARHALDQFHLPTFFWGQVYGGTLEVALVTVSVGLLGASITALKVVPVVLWVGSLVLFWLVGRRLIGARAAAFTVAVFAVSTPNYVWWSTKERGFYWMCLDLGLLTLLLAVRVVDRPEPVLGWAALGLVAGANFWTTPQSLYFTVPAIAWILHHRRARAARAGAVAAAGAFVVGALPWMVFNLTSSFASLDTSSGLPKSSKSNLIAFGRKGVPVMLGLNADERFVLQPLGKPLYVAIVLGTALLVAMRVRRISLPLIGVLAYPFVFAVFPLSQYIGEGRYLLFLAPFFWLLVMGALRSSAARIAVVSAAAILSLVTFRDIWTTNVAAAEGRRVPHDDRALIAYLDARRGATFRANYWIVYRVMYETREAAVGTPIPRTISRRAAYDRAVLEAPRPPLWIFVAEARDELAFLSGRHAPCYRLVRLGGFDLYEPRDPTTPTGCPPA